MGVLYTNREMIKDVIETLFEQALQDEIEATPICKEGLEYYIHWLKRQRQEASSHHHFI